jgi:glycosyltransferase involved in cell wall biosynthesis
MTDAPCVSAIITTYNRATVLTEAVESVLSQSYRDFELIVADDGSTDDTAVRLARFGKRVHHLKLAHSGKPEIARNRAIAQARGSYFAFLDDDDLWREDKLDRQMDALRRDEALGYAYCDCRFLEADGSLSAPLLRSTEKEDENAFSNLLQGCFVHPSTVLMRRSLFETVGPFDESLLCQGDYLLWLRAAQVAPVVCVPEPLVTLRRSPAGLSRRRRLRNVENAILVLERVRRQQRLTWKQRLRSRRTLARWQATLGLRRESAPAARTALIRSIRLNPLQLTAWKALVRRLRSA